MLGGPWRGRRPVRLHGHRLGDDGWVVVSGGAKLTDAQIDAGVAVASSWPSPPGPNGSNPSGDGDPANPGWSVQVNKPANVGIGDVTVYAVCVKKVAIED